MAVACAAIASLVNQTRLGSQAPCTHLPSEGNLTTIDGFVESILSCQEHRVASPDNWLPDGGFVKVGDTQNIVKLHTRAETSGKCTLREYPDADSLSPD